MIALLIFLLWIGSLVMMLVAFHWVWAVVFIVLTLYHCIRFAIYVDFDLFDGFNFFD